jgi:pyruvate dehydrogenase E2 component (dihydrolipoamide acetyltransferase)
MKLKPLFVLSAATAAFALGACDNKPAETSEPKTEETKPAEPAPAPAPAPDAPKPAEPAPAPAPAPDAPKPAEPAPAPAPDAPKL